MKLKPLIVGAVIVIVLVGAWLGQGLVTVQSSQTEVLLMDTFVRLVVDGPNAETILQQAVDEMARLEGILSAHIEGSEVWKVNKSMGQPVGVSPEVIDVLEKAKLVYEQSNGAFDVTIGAVLRLWGFGTDEMAVPTAENLAEVLQGVGFHNVTFDRVSGTVQLTNPHTQLDLGGVAKGYIVDRTMSFIRAQGVKSAIVDAGGDVRILGGRPGQYVWDKPRAARVGVQDPVSPEDLVAVVEISDGSVLTSGDYERFFVEDGVRYTHIIDPRTGYPVRGLTSVTIVTEEAALADAIATAVMVMGKTAGLDLINSWAGVEGMLITEDEEIIMSTGMQSLTNVLR